jgi:N-acylneuraminate cytidylyltransferase
MSFENVLAVIPARRGSKRFPHKNTALFDGKSLVANTIQIAKEAGIDKILVTTDDVDVITIAAVEGVKYLNRPKDLCTDDARMEPVVENAVHYAMSATDGPHWEFDTICLMQVTSPLLRLNSLQVALNTYLETGAESLTATNLLHEPCGAFYIVDHELFMKNKSFYQEGGGLYMLGAEQCIDVDHKHQLAIANIIAAGRRE